MTPAHPGTWKWNRMRALIEAGQRKLAAAGSTAGGTEAPQEPIVGIGPTDWDDTKQAQHDGSRQIYGDAGKFMRGGEPGC